MRARPLSFLLVVLLCLSSILAMTAAPVLGNHTIQAAGTIIRVTTTRDEINENTSCSLREALLAANRNTRTGACPAGSGVDTILIPAGSFTLTILGAGEDYGLTGDLDIQESVNIRGAGNEITTFHTDIDFNDRFFHILSPAVTAQISDLRMAGGKIIVEEGAVNPEPGGGAIYNLGTLLLTNTLFYLNEVSGPGTSGGAIYNAGTLTVTNTTFDRSSSEDQGGAISNHGAMLIDTLRFIGNHGGAILNAEGSTAVIENSLFHENGKGYVDELVRVGAIDQAGQMEIRGSVFQWNRGREAGAIRNSGDLRIEDSTIKNSESWEGPSAIEQIGGNLTLLRVAVLDNVGGFDGGGLVIDNAESVRVENSLISGNSNYHGGGIRHKNGPTTIINTTISNNSAYNGGGMEINGEGVRIINSTISGNDADEEGGGIFSRGSFTIENSTVSENRSFFAGGLYLAGANTTILNTTITNNRMGGMVSGYGYTGTTRVGSSIIAGNYDNEEEVPGMRDCLFTSGSLVSLGRNLVGTTGECGWTPAAGDLLGTDSSTIDAMLAPLRNNGGLTLTHALMTGSPALDAAGTQNCPAADQRGIPRPQGAACDIGSFEREAAQPIIENPIFLPMISR